MKDIYDLKKIDRDRFLLSLFIHKAAERDFIQNLDMLNFELSKIRDTIDTLYMGFIRLQWWRDEIKKISQGQKYQSHPLLDKIALLHKERPINFEGYNALISAREADFEEYESFDIKSYARNTHTPLIMLKANLLGEEPGLKELAEAYALIGLLRAIPFYKARSQVLMPEISPAAVKNIVDYALSLIAGKKFENRYWRAHATLTKLYASQLEKCGYNPENITPLPFKELRVWWGSR